MATLAARSFATKHGSRVVWLSPEGGLALQGGRDFTNGTSYGSVNESDNIRPQHAVNVDMDSFPTGLGGFHDVKYGVGFRRADGATVTTWPGKMILGIENSPTNLVARVNRQGNATNRADYFDLWGTSSRPAP